MALRLQGAQSRFFRTSNESNGDVRDAHLSLQEPVPLRPLTFQVPLLICTARGKGAVIVGPELGFSQPPADCERYFVALYRVAHTEVRALQVS